MQELSEYIKVQPGESGHIVLCFSSIGIPKGKFSSSNALKESQHTIIYVNTSENDWYLNGIPGAGNSIDESISLLSKLILFYRSHNGVVCSFGGSMGGYAALLYGSLLRVNLILATCPESEIYITGGYSDKLSKKKYSDDLLPNIYAEVQAAIDDNVKIKLYYGSNPSLDYISAIKLAKLYNLDIELVRYYGHKIPLFIEGRFGLNNFIDENIKDTFILPSKEKSIVNLLEISDSYIDHVIYKKNIDSNFDYRTHELYKEITSVELRIHYVWQTYIKKELRKELDYKETINYLSPCIDCDYPLPAALNEVANKAFKSKQYRLAEEYFRILIEKYHDPKIHRTYWKALLKYSLCLKHKGDMKNAQKIALSAKEGLGRIIKNFDYYIELANLYIKLSLLKEAQMITFECLKYQPHSQKSIDLQRRIFKKIRCDFFIDEC